MFPWLVGHWYFFLRQPRRTASAALIDLFGRVNCKVCKSWCLNLNSLNIPSKEIKKGYITPNIAFLNISTPPFCGETPGSYTPFLVFHRLCLHLRGSMRSKSLLHGVPRRWPSEGSSWGSCRDEWVDEKRVKQQG